MDRALINRIDALRIDRNVQRVPSWCVQLAVFGLALAIVVSRRPDAVSNPQFWAEDGKFWYADAYNTGGIRPFLWPYFGYLHFVPRLTALVAQALPLRRGPLLFNLVAIVIEILPVQLLVSSRLSGLGGVSTRMLLAFLCLSLPHTSETHSNITNAQWYLALLAFLVLVSAPARTWGWRSFDILAVVSSSLSGPFAFMLAPVAALVWWKRRGRKPLELLLITIGGALIQGATMPGVKYISSRYIVNTIFRLFQQPVRGAGGREWVVSYECPLGRAGGNGRNGADSLRALQGAP
ncbi:MAG: hypothetical protein DMG25_11250 [Acidobacteria bacterium]|nr:MAG: hypothetical protein DMG25_11250 [Acidobacteriota bacterium]